MKYLIMFFFATFLIFSCSSDGDKNEPEVIEVPDTDGDGILDNNDDCPNVIGIAALNGCPDTDGDGISDNNDECPNVVGIAALNGCPVPDPVVEYTVGLEGEWRADIYESEDVGNPVNYPHFAYYPDGHISVLPDGDEYIMFWAEFESHRSIGSTQFVEDQVELQPSNAVFGRRGNFDTYDNGGSWLMSVFREENDNFIGFFHAEDHWYPREGNTIAWKSLGVTYSDDKGQTWSEGVQIITSPNDKPADPAWGGSGDCCVIWDHINNRWLCYYQENWMYMAISEDPKGAPGTWKKYFNGEFTEPGLGGNETPVPGLSPGANPSVHWNTHLEKWVMVWHSWGNSGRINLSVSADGINWSTPQIIVESERDGRAWYPTIIGSTDVEGGKEVRIYYADFNSAFSNRLFKARNITFFKPGE